MTSEIERGQSTATRAKTGVAISAGAAAVVALIIVAIVLSWAADAWAAAATWVTAAVAGIAGAVAVGQLGEARRLRVEQAQPYVVAFMEPSAAGRFFVDLVIRNFGTTAAHDVRLEIDPAPRRHAGGAGSVWLPESIPVLVPGQEWRTFWDTGRRWEADLPARHEAVVAFKDSQGKALAPLRSILDWSALKDQMTVDDSLCTAAARYSVDALVLRLSATRRIAATNGRSSRLTLVVKLSKGLMDSCPGSLVSIQAAQALCTSAALTSAPLARASTAYSRNRRSVSPSGITLSGTSVRMASASTSKYVMRWLRVVPRCTSR